MKLALLSDLHLHPFSQFSTLGPDGFNSRLYQIARVVQRIFQDAAKEGCRGILFAGDWFHTRTVAREVLDLTGRILMMAQNLGLTIGMVPGNHDMVTDGKFSPIHALRSMGSSIKLLDEGSIEFGKEEFRVAGLAYCNQRDELMAKAKLLKGQDLLVLHAPCVGAEMASDLVAQDEEDTLKTEQLIQISKSKMIICGHYHKPQIWRGGEWTSEIADGGMRGKWLSSVRALIPGAPCQHTFGDQGQSRGWWILDTERSLVKFHPLLGEVPEFLRVGYGQFLADPSKVVDRFVDLEIPEEVSASLRGEIVETVQGVAAGLRITIIAREAKAEPPRTLMRPGMAPMELVQIYAEKDPPPCLERTMELAKGILEKSE